MSGTGSVPLYHLMEDAATAEISRVQNWQWIKYGAVLDGEAVPVRVTREMFSRVMEEEMGRIKAEVGTKKFGAGRYQVRVEGGVGGKGWEDGGGGEGWGGKTWGW